MPERGTLSKIADTLREQVPTRQQRVALTVSLFTVTAIVLNGLTGCTDGGATATAEAADAMRDQMNSALATEMPTIVKRSTCSAERQATRNALATKVTGWNRGLALGTPLPLEASTPVPPFKCSLD
jgi:hypothetical protein